MHPLNKNSSKRQEGHYELSIIGIDNTNNTI